MGNKRLGDYIFEYSKRNKTERELPVYSVTNDKGFCTEYFSKDVASKDKSTYKVVPRGYFAYNPSRINVGSIDWQNCEDEVIVSPLYVVFGVDETINKQYLLYYLKSDIAKTYIRAMATGSVRDNLKFTTLKEFPIQLRSQEEQNKIVARLDKVRQLIALREEELKQFDDLIKSQFIEMFVDKGYPTISIGEVVADKIGSAKKSFKQEDTIKYIDISSIDNQHNVMTGYTEYVFKDAPSRAQQHIRRGDILVSTVRPNLRNVAITNYEYDNLVASSGFCVLRAQDCKPEYLMAVVCSDDFTRAMTAVVTGANYPAIKDADVKGFMIPFPNIEAQNKFSRFVEQTDKSKDNYEMEVAA